MLPTNQSGNSVLRDLTFVKEVWRKYAKESGMIVLRDLLGPMRLTLRERSVTLRNVTSCHPRIEGDTCGPPSHRKGPPLRSHGTEIVSIPEAGSRRSPADRVANCATLHGTEHPLFLDDPDAFAPTRTDRHGRAEIATHCSFLCPRPFAYWRLDGRAGTG